MADDISSLNGLQRRFAEFGIDLSDGELANVAPAIADIRQMIERLAEIDASEYEPASIFSPESVSPESAAEDSRG